MYPHVKSHLTSHGEAFLTDGAFVRSLPSVCSPVDLQLSCRAEGLAAVRAEERFLPRVSPDVYRQVSVHREPLGAVGTLVRPLAGVSPHVELQVSFAPEGLSTAGADLGPLLGVTLLVVILPDLNKIILLDISNIMICLSHFRLTIHTAFSLSWKCVNLW